MMSDFNFVYLCDNKGKIIDVKSNNLNRGNLDKFFFLI